MQTQSIAAAALLARASVPSAWRDEDEIDAVLLGLAGDARDTALGCPTVKMAPIAPAVAPVFWPPFSRPSFPPASIHRRRQIETPPAGGRAVVLPGAQISPESDPAGSAG